MLLQEKVVIVTGSANGLGKGIARACHADGAKVVIADLEQAACQLVVDELGSNALAVACDVCSDEAQQNVIDKAVEKWGRVDCIVNNAGINFAKPFLETTRQDWDKVIDTNLRGVFFFMQKLCKYWIENQIKGSIVNISSVHNQATLPGAGPYAATKNGLLGIMKSVVNELSSKGIRINTVSPGLCNTNIWQDIIEAAPSEKECLDYWKQQIPIGRPSEPEEIGYTVSFLLSNRSSSTTGTNIYVDGGMTSQLISQAPYDSESID
ncbi:SDR family oxidoreductase [Lentisphaera profundi]|uniref:SDR family oxidoreductase n=1 Tax=Lentisphaera profundi TaxID=1658616 RepID=A0ABY7VPV5_9BACT|nr:SDR family oxidoreductase [Lentisphaera profundi]WDE95275.1 SDR family oxidoreductase [Lentisphaera profundi]